MFMLRVKTDGKAQEGLLTRSQRPVSIQVDNIFAAAFADFAAAAFAAAAAAIAAVLLRLLLLLLSCMRASACSDRLPKSFLAPSTTSRQQQKHCYAFRYIHVKQVSLLMPTQKGPTPLLSLNAYPSCTTHGCEHTKHRVFSSLRISPSPPPLSPPLPPAQENRSIPLNTVINKQERAHKVPKAASRAVLRYTYTW